MKAHPTFHTDTLNFFAYDKHLSISYCICPIIDDYSSYLRYLHDEELQYYNTLKYEKRIKDYLIGRYCAKIAVSQIVSVDNLAEKIWGLRNFPCFWPVSLSCLFFRQLGNALITKERFLTIWQIPDKSR